MLFNKLVHDLKRKAAGKSTFREPHGATYSDMLAMEAVQVVIDASKHVPAKADVHVWMMFEGGDMVACRMEHLCSSQTLPMAGTPTLVQSPILSTHPAGSKYLPLSDLKLAAAARILSPHAPQSYPLSPADFRVYQLLGQGAQGTVSLVQYERNGLFYALKAIKKSALKPHHFAFAFQEQAILKELVGCAFFLQLRGSFEDDEYFYLLTDFYPGGDLAQKLAKLGNLGAAESKWNFAQLVLALEELHRHRILHRDIKPGNILFTVDGKLIISDFGFSRPFGLTAKQQPWRLRDEWVLGPGAETSTGVVVSSSYDVTHRECGTLGYMAPEVIRTGEFYSYSADIYSAGVVLYEMLNGVLPFNLENKVHDIPTVYDAMMSESVEVNDDVSADARDLLQKMLEKESSHRPTLEEIKSHPWLFDVDWKQLVQRRMAQPLRPRDDFRPHESAGEVSFGTAYPAGEEPHWWFRWSSPKLLEDNITRTKKSLRKDRAAWKKPSPVSKSSTSDVPATLSAMFATPAPHIQGPLPCSTFLTPLTPGYPGSRSPTMFIPSTATSATAVERSDELLYPGFGPSSESGSDLGVSRAINACAIFVSPIFDSRECTSLQSIPL